MKTKQLLLGLVFAVMFSISASAQGHDGRGQDARDARITLNKEKVERYAKERLSKSCRHGVKDIKVQLDGSTYKVHFKTNCEQRGEIHYNAEWATHKKTIFY